MARKAIRGPRPKGSSPRPAVRREVSMPSSEVFRRPSADRSREGWRREARNRVLRRNGLGVTRRKDAVVVRQEDDGAAPRPYGLPVRRRSVLFDVLLALVV